MDKRTKNFISFKEKASIKFNNKFDYSQSHYTKSQNPIIIICPEHGEFTMSPNQHLNSTWGCPKCALKYGGLNRRDTQESFIRKVKEKYGELFTFEKTKYVRSNKPVIITGPNGDITITPNNLLTHYKMKKYSRKPVKNRESFVSEASKIHDNKYDYSKVVYKNIRTKVCIICPIHGEFWQAPDQHLKGRGCQACGHLKTTEHTKSNTEDFIKKAKEIWCEIYDYSKVKYINNHKKIIVTCPEHGDFLVTPGNHLKLRGCPMCNTSKGELRVKSFLEELQIPFKWQFSIHTENICKNTNLAIVDFYIEYNNDKYIIEYNGHQHYEFIPRFHKSEQDFIKQINRDAVVREYCLKNNIYLLEIRYDNSDIKNTIRQFLKINANSS